MSKYSEESQNDKAVIVSKITNERASLGNASPEMANSETVVVILNNNAKVAQI